MSDAERGRSDRLNEELDAFVAGEAARDPDPTTAAAVRHLFLSDDAPPLPHDLMNRIWEDIMHQPAFAPTVAVSSSAGTVARDPRGRAQPTLNGRVESGRRRPRFHAAGPLPWRPELVRLATTALVLVALVVGYASVGPVRLGPDRSAPIPGAVAPASPTVAPYPRTAHPIIGVWQLDLDTSEPGTNLTTGVFHDTGLYTQTDMFAEVIGVSLGTWRPTGERTIEVSTVIQGVTNQDRFAPTQVPQPNAFVPGWQVRRMTITIDETGAAFAFTCHFDQYDADGTLASSFDFDGTGARMAVVTTDADGTPTP